MNNGIFTTDQLVQDFATIHRNRIGQATPGGQDRLALEQRADEASG